MPGVVWGVPTDSSADVKPNHLEANPGADTASDDRCPNIFTNAGTDQAVSWRS